MRTFALSLSGLLAALLMTEPDQPGCGAPFADPRGCADSAAQGQAPGAGSAGGLGPESYTIESESLSEPSPSLFGDDGGAPATGSGTHLDVGTSSPTIDLETLGSGTR